MRVLVVGTGVESSKIGLHLSQQGHKLAGQIPTLSASDLDVWDFQALIVVEPESPLTPVDALQQAVERGRHVLVVGAETGPLAAWARAARLPALPYPPTEADLRALTDELARREAGRADTAEEYARAALGGDLAARTQASMARRRVVVTGPKGGTGKTTVSVNLALLLALCGVKTYLVDADANAGAVHLHLRLREVRQTLIRLLRRFEASDHGDAALGGLAAGGRLLQSFTPVPDLPGLFVLPGFLTPQDLADPVLQDEARVRAFFRTLYEVAAAAGGVMVVDVGINPAHVVHRAALAFAETVAVVVQPEVPDLAQTRQWLLQMVRTLVDREGLSRDEALTFVRSRIRIVYNMVWGRIHEEARKVLERALREDGLPLDLAPHGVLPLVPKPLAYQAVSSEDRGDVFVLRYRRKRDPELASYVRALVGLAANFVPTAPEAAVRLGLVAAAESKKKRRIPFLGRLGR